MVTVFSDASRFYGHADSGPTSGVIAPSTPSRKQTSPLRVPQGAWPPRALNSLPGPSRHRQANRSTSHVKRSRTKTTVVSIRSASDRLETQRLDAQVDCSYRRFLGCLDSWVSGFPAISRVSGFLGVWIPWVSGFQANTEETRMGTNRDKSPDEPETSTRNRKSRPGFDTYFSVPKGLSFSSSEAVAAEAYYSSDQPSEGEQPSQWGGNAIK